MCKKFQITTQELSTSSDKFNELTAVHLVKEKAIEDIVVEVRMEFASPVAVGTEVDLTDLRLDLIARLSCFSTRRVSLPFEQKVHGIHGSRSLALA